MGLGLVQSQKQTLSPQMIQSVERERESLYWHLLLQLKSRGLDSTTEICAQFLAACVLIRSLEPHPGSYFSAGESPGYITPDIIVVNCADRLELLPNDQSLAKYRDELGMPNTSGRKKRG